jgi:mono/diheme cytochrome c family protein
LPENGVPRNARFDDANEPLDARARAYLDINCGHCHSAKGPADTSGLWLDAATRDPIRLGECKPPVAAGQGTGDHIFDVVPGRPDESILVYRMSSLDPGAMMPEVGRTTVHAEGVALVRDWIKAWLGDCSSSAVASSTTVSN